MPRTAEQFRARSPGEPWVYFGTNYVAAMAAYAAWRCEGPTTNDTVAWLMELVYGNGLPGQGQGAAAVGAHLEGLPFAMRP